MGEKDVFRSQSFRTVSKRHETGCLVEIRTAHYMPRFP